MKEKKRKKPIPKRELEIGQRLREARELLKFSQSEFAEQLRITKKRLASYEELRVPLRFDLALRICRQFILSEKWLATGAKGNMRLLLDLSAEPITHKIPLDTPFGEAFDKFLAPVYESVFSQENGQIRIRISPGEDLSFIINLFNYTLPFWAALLPKEEVPRFLTMLLDVGFKLIESFKVDGKLPELIQWQEPALREKLVEPAVPKR